MDPHVLKIINAEIRSRRAVLRVTQLSDGRDRAIREGEPVAGELCAAVRKAFLSGKPALVEADGEQWFLNVYLPSPRLVIIGAVHISQALVPMAKIAGFEVSLIDPRTGFASQERFPGGPAGSRRNPFGRGPAHFHGTGSADPRSEDRRSGPDGRTFLGLLLCGAGSRKTHSRWLSACIKQASAANGPPGSRRRSDWIFEPGRIAVAILASIVRIAQRELAPAPASTAGVSA